MNHIRKKHLRTKPVSVRVLEPQALQEVTGGSVRITGQDPAPAPDNRDM